MENAEILNLAEIILNEEEEFFLPVEKLFELILEEKESLDLSLGDFIKILESDKRFRLIENKNFLEAWDNSDDAKLRDLGFYSGPRVLLIDRLPSEEEIIQTLTEKMQSSLSAMRETYRARPIELTDEEELEYIQIMKKVRDLQAKLGDWRDQDSQTN